MLGALALLAALAWGSRSSAATHVEVLVIGNNRPPIHGPESPSEAQSPTLRFADDDAAAFYEFIMAVADHGHLLTLMDRDTQVLYPELVSVAKVPTLSEVRAAVAQIGRRLERYKAAGDSSSVFLFFSGHGSLDATGTPELALMDGGITQKFLYESIIERLPADVLHLFIDACHAEAVVRPRDVDAQSVDVSAGHANAILVQSTLARYPRVGAILAAASDGQSHEWDYLRQGVFTHELLSALRGGADVNQDGRLEYSEVYAFLSAANRGVEDARARLTVVARAPDVDRRIAVVEFAMFRKSKPARLTSIPARARALQVFDDAGRRLATLHGEPDYVSSLLIPAGRTIYLRSGQQESQFRSSAGQAVAFETLRFAASPERSRGALDDALRRGLFATRFGHGYYSGFIERDSDFVPVTLVEVKGVRPSDTPENVPSSSERSATHNLGLGFGLSSAIADELSISEGLSVGLRPRQTSGLILSLDLLLASTKVLREWRSGAALGWVWQKRVGRVSGFLGASAGAGVIVQDMDDRPTRSSALGSVTPLLGLDARLSRGYSIWTKADASVLVYQRDEHVRASLAPALWLGGSFGL
ncbi:MAG TPA: caspase family protein [Polyangiaceae bacterium]|nr:caspase family protein [Polyangiaceae bacterium]